VAVATGDARALEPRPAATLIVVRQIVGNRDDEGGGRAAEVGSLEVLLLRRSASAAFASDAYVFPGGARDEEDQAPELVGRCAGLTDAQASARLGMNEGGLGYFIAAIRESFEEAGVLFARRAGSAHDVAESPSLISFEDEAVGHRFSALRQRLRSGAIDFAGLCAEEDLELAVECLYPFSHWITPVGPPRRYDTRFFLAEAPAGQVVEHDSSETVAHCWITPSEAMARAESGSMLLMFPTLRNLEAVGRFGEVADLISSLEDTVVLPTQVPVIVAEGRGWRVRLPGDVSGGSYVDHAEGARMLGISKW